MFINSFFILINPFYENKNSNKRNAYDNNPFGNEIIY